MKTFLLFIVIWLYPSLIIAQKNAAWDYYTKENDAASKVKVNTVFYQAAPIDQTPYLIKISHNYKAADAAGLPPKAEMVSINRMQDNTVTTISSKATCNMAGCSLQDKQCTSYYYVSDTTGLRSTLQSLYGKKYKNCNIEIKPDTKWAGYFDYLYPNEKERQMIYYDRVVVRLLKLGDKLKKPHKVIHTAYFKNEDDMKTFQSLIAKQKYTVLSTSHKPQSKYALKFYNISPITSKVIINTAIQLKKTTLSNSGVYNGWETTVALK